MGIFRDLASETPLWLALTTVGVNAVVGALRAQVDDDRHWDIVGLSTFGVLMGLGGGFIRDLLTGDLPVESLRTPWYLTAVIGAIVVVLLVTGVYALVDVWDPQIAGLAGIITAEGAHFAARQLGLRTRRAEGPSGLLLTRSKK